MTMPHHRNHVLLLRHCVRSTSTRLDVCDGDVEWRARLTDYVKAPLPDWGVPTQWCTVRGENIIRDLASYLINDAINVTSDMHVVVKIISDTHHRDVDTSLALLGSMNDALKGYSFSGLDQISINHDVFGHTRSWTEKTCPQYYDQEIYDQISNRISLLPPSDFPVQDVIDRIVSLGGLYETIYLENNSSMFDPRCSKRILNLPLQLLELIAETALYSRASRIRPPFLPSASNDDLYRMLYVADYISALEILDNKASARRGLVLAKSMLGGMVDDASWRMDVGDKKEVVTVTVFVGHQTNINDVATTFGLRWTMPPPYVHDRNGNVGKVVSIPPGSGIMFTSSEEEEDVTMSYIVPLNLIDKKKTATIKHQMIPVYTIDMAQPESAVRDGRSRNGRISMNDLKLRVEATSRKYPDIRPCYEDAPVFLGINGSQKSTAPNSAPLLLVAIAGLNLIGCVFFFITRHGRPNKKYEHKKYEQVPVENQQEIELC